MNAVTVYCASSPHVDSCFVDAARIVGETLARHGVTLVHGGGRVGLMGALGHACVQAGGRVVGITTEQFVELEQASTDCQELVVVDSMQARRRLLMDRADGILVLPGGLGTLEEFFEALVGLQLGHHQAPIGLINIDGALSPLLAMLDDMVERRFVREAARELFFVETDARRAVERLLAMPAVEVDPQRTVPSGSG